MKRQILMLAMLLCTSLAMAQSKFNVKGIIIDKETDEALIAASVQLTKRQPQLPLKLPRSR